MNQKRRTRRSSGFASTVARFEGTTVLGMNQLVSVWELFWGEPEDLLVCLDSFGSLSLGMNLNILVETRRDEWLSALSLSLSLSLFLGTQVA